MKSLILFVIACGIILVLIFVGCLIAFPEIRIPTLVVFLSMSHGFMFWIGGKHVRNIHREGAELGTHRADVEGRVIGSLSSLGGTMLKHQETVHQRMAAQLPAPESQHNNPFVIPANFSVEE